MRIDLDELRRRAIEGGLQNLAPFDFINVNNGRITFKPGTSNAQLLQILKATGLISDDDAMWFSQFFTDPENDWLVRRFNDTERLFDYTRDDFSGLNDENWARMLRLKDTLNQYTETGSIPVTSEFRQNFPSSSIQSYTPVGRDAEGNLLPSRPDSAVQRRQAIDDVVVTQDEMSQYDNIVVDPFDIPDDPPPPPPKDLGDALPSPEDPVWPPGDDIVYTGGSPNFDETTGQYRNLPGGMTLGGNLPQGTFPQFDLPDFGNISAYMQNKPLDVPQMSEEELRQIRQGGLLGPVNRGPGGLPEEYRPPSNSPFAKFPGIVGGGLSGFDPSVIQQFIQRYLADRGIDPQDPNLPAEGADDVPVPADSEEEVIKMKDGGGIAGLMLQDNSPARGEGIEAFLPPVDKDAPISRDRRKAALRRTMQRLEQEQQQQMMQQQQQMAQQQQPPQGMPPQGPPGMPPQGMMPPGPPPTAQGPVPTMQQGIMPMAR